MTAAAGETAGNLRAGGSVVLDGTGKGTISVNPQNARQRWEVDSVVVKTNQAQTATPVPVAEVFINSVLSPAGSQGATWSGSQDTFSGVGDVGPCDVLNIVFTGGIPGITAYANVSGTRYTRRT